MPLVTRNHPKLTAEGARAVRTTAHRRASEIRCPMNIAVVDEGAHLLLFERMDGAKPSSIASALVKAQAAARRRSPRGATMAGENVNIPVALGLAIAGLTAQTPIRGGVPIVADGQVVGAIGVSAGSDDQDRDVAPAGAAALEKA